MQTNPDPKSTQSKKHETRQVLCEEETRRPKRTPDRLQTQLLSATCIHRAVRNRIPVDVLEVITSVRVFSYPMLGHADRLLHARVDTVQVRSEPHPETALLAASTGFDRFRQASTGFFADAETPSFFAIDLTRSPAHIHAARTTSLLS
jgi:hypothetical protein